MTDTRAVPHAQDDTDEQVVDRGWQPLGLLARKIARDLSIPTPTVVAALEANGIEVVN